MSILVTQYIYSIHRYVKLNGNLLLYWMCVFHCVFVLSFIITNIGMFITQMITNNSHENFSPPFRLSSIKFISILLLRFFPHWMKNDFFTKKGRKIYHVIYEMTPFILIECVCCAVFFFFFVCVSSLVLLDILWCTDTDVVGIMKWWYTYEWYRTKKEATSL